MNSIKLITACCCLFVLAIAISMSNIATGESTNNTISADTDSNSKPKVNRTTMNTNKSKLGNFSVSLAVKDLKASKAFYEKLDFAVVGGKLEQNYLIMQNDTTNIGLFQGMFKDNILTFNPGWNHKQETLKDFKDVRDLQSMFNERGITPVKPADESTTGPASFVIVDPDGNNILFDQHVPKPE